MSLFACVTYQIFGRNFNINLNQRKAIRNEKRQTHNDPNSVKAQE